MKAEELDKYILDLYHENRLSHAYLIETNNLTKCCDDLINIIKHINCDQEFSENCSKCNLCNLLNTRVLPSFIFIEPDGKIIKREAIDKLRQNFTKKPIYTTNNIYIIKSPEKMNSASYNSLLKFIEEPEDNIIGFLITDNKDSIAPTILSRLNILKVNYANENEEDQIISSIAQHFYKICNDKKQNLIFFNVNELYNQLGNRENIVTFLKILYTIYDKSLMTNYDINLNKMKIIAKYLEQLNYNVNVNLLLDSFALEMSE